MNKRTVMTALLAWTLVVPAGCAGNPAGLPVAQMTFANYAPIPVNVRDVNIQTQAAGPGEGDFIMDPQAAAQEYLKARFAPRGLQGALSATIEEASVRKARKESSDKVARFFAMGGQDVYQVTLRVRFDHLDNAGNVVYGKVLTARRALHITEHASVAEREGHMLEGLEAMFRDLDREVQNMVAYQMHLTSAD